MFCIQVSITIRIVKNCSLSVQMIKIHVAFLVSDAFTLFIETVARTRPIGQMPGGVFRGTLATIKQQFRFNIITQKTRSLIALLNFKNSQVGIYVSS